MSSLPDPSTTLTGTELATYQQMTQVRGEGRLPAVYVRMFNNPVLAAKVGALGETLRFNGLLPGDIRELVILYLAERMRIGYEWVHHLGPAEQAGLSPATIAALAEGTMPTDLRPDQVAALAAAGATYELRSIPDQAQGVLTDRFGAAGVVELVSLVGLYRLIAGMIRACDVDIEDGLPAPPF